MMRPYGCVSQNPPHLVSELINNTSATWMRDRLEQFFLPLDVLVIMGIPLCTRNVEDQWAWNFEKNGLFTVRSAYKMSVSTRTRREAWLDENARSSTLGHEESSWKLLWRTHVPGKIRIFL